MCSLAIGATGNVKLGNSLMMNKAYGGLDSDKQEGDNSSDDDTIDEDDRQIIRLNIGGTHHEVLSDTLLKLPNSRLGKLASKYIDRSCDKPIFFDRHPAVFLTILDLYRTGELHFPTSVCGAVLKRELDYWGIPQKSMQPCCVTNFGAFYTTSNVCLNTQQIVSDDLLRMSETAPTKWKRLQNKVTYLYENPTVSAASLVLGVVSYLMVLASITTLCLESMEVFQEEANLTSLCPGMEADHDDEHGHRMIVANDTIEYVDNACTIFFTFELLARFIFAPSKTKLIRQLLTIIDLLALFPAYVHIILHLAGVNAVCQNETILEFLHAVTFLRMLRVFHSFNLLRHYGPFQVLIFTLKNAGSVIFMLSVFLIIAVLVLGNLIYFLEKSGASEEHDDPGKIHNIPEGYWWAIVTMTTIGYGDKVPKTTLGYIIGGFAAVAGVILISFVVPILSNIFNMVYNFHQASGIVYAKDKGNVLEKWKGSCQKKLKKVRHTIRRYNSRPPAAKNHKNGYPPTNDNNTVTANSKKKGVEILLNNDDVPETII